MRKPYVPGHMFERYRAKAYLDLASQTAGVVTTLVQAGRAVAPYIRPALTAAVGAL